MTVTDEYRAPRSAVEAFAQQFGTSPSYAQSYLDRMGPPSAEWEEADEALKAAAAAADLEAARSLNDIDIEDAAEADDPAAELRSMVDQRSQWRLRAQIAANTRWANTPEDERRRSMDKAREAFDARFEREVDPDGTLSPQERARRAAHARKAYFARLALKSAQARRKRKK